MQRYEVVAIVKADLAEDDLAAIIERSQSIITDRKGIIAKVEKWGKRRLAYEIKKQKDGFYFLIDLVGDGPIVAEIERNFKIDDRILKFMTVKKEGAVTAEGMEKETAAAETRRMQSRNETGAAGSSAAQQGDKTAGEATPRRFAPRKIYNREEQPARGE